MAIAHNGDEIYVEVHGQGPAVIVFNANPRPPDHPARDQLLTFGHEMVGFGDTARDQRAELEQLGWEVAILPGHDHTSLIDATAIAPVLGPFLDRSTPWGVDGT